MYLKEMRRKTGIEKQLTNYLKEEEIVKEMCRDFVFNRYLERADYSYEDALDTITGDMYILERLERFERCQILKDILIDFE